MPDTVPQPAPRTGLYCFAAAIVVVGTIRFLLTVNSAPDSIARWASMTGVIAAGILVYGQRTRTHRERWRVAFAFIIPYMFVETVGLGYTWWTRTETIFHAPEYSFGTSPGVHLAGHIIGGLTWEPAMAWAALWAVGTASRLIFPSDPL